MSDADVRDGITIREAVERYLSRRRADATEQSVRAWRYRLKLFAEWCDDQELERVDDVDRLNLDEYYGHRASAVSPATLEGEMWTLKMFAQFLEQLGLVEDDLASAVRIPDVDPDDRSNEVRLDAPDAIALIRHYRTSDRRASRAHAYLELAWVTGARKGGLRALDLRDVHVDDDYVDFVNRPGTTLKKNSRGERPVALPPETTIVLKEYIEGGRYDVHDEHNRAPLLASREGRPSLSTMTTWSYLATLPCLHSPCPHGRERSTCEYTRYAHASKCPSSRSPHKIRTGSITWQLDLGIPPEVVANRTNASLETIEQHYDVADPRERMESRRRPYIENMNL